MEIINLGTEEDKKEVKIGANLELSVRQRLTQMLHDYVEIFSWSYEDMPGLDTDIVVHHLPTKEDCPPVKQKVRRMRPEMSEKIKAEVMKQFDAGFLAVTSYPQWVANVVPVPKKDGKVRMCVDYRDLNRASPRMTSPYLTLMSLLTIQLNTRCSPSWMVFQGIIRSRWLLKTWKRLPLLLSGAPSATRSCLLD